MHTNRFAAGFDFSALHFEDCVVNILEIEGVGDELVARDEILMHITVSKHPMQTLG